MEKGKVHISVRLEEEIKSVLEEKARSLGMSVSGYVRMKIMKWLDE